MADEDAGLRALPGLLSRGVALAERLLAENARLRRELDAQALERREAEEENHELASLYIAARQMHGTREPRDVIGAVAEILLNFVGAKVFAIYVRDAAAGLLRPVVAHGVELETLEPARPDSAIGKVFRDGQALLGADVRPADPLGAPRLAVPLRLGADAVGVLAVWALLAHKTELYPVDRALFDLISTHAARALDAARLAAGAVNHTRLDYASLAGVL